MAVERTQSVCSTASTTSSATSTPPFRSQVSKLPQMVSPTNVSQSDTTAQLEVKSLQLEIVAIQQSREIDKKEFTDFATAAANKNFIDIVNILKLI